MDVKVSTHQVWIYYCSCETKLKARVNSKYDKCCVKKQYLKLFEEESLETTIKTTGITPERVIDQISW